MHEILIQYRDSSGEVTERIISDYHPDGEFAIDAYCHVRNARRTFKLSNIIYAANPETDEVLPNVWQAFGMAKAANGRERLDFLGAAHLSTIKALKFFTIYIRGFAKRERDHIIQFIRENTNTDSYSDVELDEWLKKLWAGDVYAYSNGETAEYDALIHAIPESLKSASRKTAIAIAAGSGRRQLAQDVLERINHAFG